MDWDWDWDWPTGIEAEGPVRVLERVESWSVRWLRVGRMGCGPALSSEA